MAHQDKNNKYKYRKYHQESSCSRSDNNLNNDYGDLPMSSIVANHYNSINNNNIQERKKSRIYYMRNFNNWVKSIIISKFKILFLNLIFDQYKLF